MANRPTTLISIDGGPLAPGSLTVESDGRLNAWKGDVQAFHEPDRRVRVMAVSDHAVYFGNALLNVATMPPPDGDEPPTSGFVGNGDLHRRGMGEVVELLFASVTERAS